MRMGFPKALLPVNNDYAVVSLAKTLFSYHLKTCITLPHFLLKNQILRNQLTTYNANISLNRYEHEGFSGSIRTILERTKGFDGIVIIPVDAPFLSPSLLLTLINIVRLYKHSPSIVVPYAQGMPGHPVYFSHHFFNDLMKCHTIGGPRAIIQRNQKYVRRILWSDARILKNLNQKQDVETMAYNQILL